MPLPAFDHLRISGCVDKAIDTSLVEILHENTKIHPIPNSPNIPIPHKNPEAVSRAFKKYRHHRKFPITQGESKSETLDNGLTFDAVVKSRRSIRGFASKPLPIESLSYVITRSYGVTGRAETVYGEELMGLRASPSAGGCYPAEIYVATRSVTGLPAGLYHYGVQDNCFEQIREGDLTSQLYDACCYQAFANDAAVAVIITGVVARTTSKYRDRGYRYVLLDIGHLGQSIYLAATALGLAVTSSGGFFDDRLAELLQISGTDEFPMYLVFLGLRSTDEASNWEANSEQDGRISPEMQGR